MGLLNTSMVARHLVALLPLTYDPENKINGSQDKYVSIRGFLFSIHSTMDSTTTTHYKFLDLPGYTSHSIL